MKVPIAKEREPQNPEIGATKAGIFALLVELLETTLSPKESDKPDPTIIDATFTDVEPSPPKSKFYKLTHG